MRKVLWTTSAFEEKEIAEIRDRLKSHKYRQEVTSSSYRLGYRLRLFKMVITRTLTYASGTWTLSKVQERIIKSTQRKMQRFIVQMKRKYQNEAKQGNESG